MLIMGFRFFRRMKIAPGLTLNLSKSGPSLSFGQRGVRRTVGIPDTGLFYTTTGGGSRRSRHGSGKEVACAADEPAVNPNERLTIGFFRRLVTPKGGQHHMRALLKFPTARWNLRATTDVRTSSASAMATNVSLAKKCRRRTSRSPTARSSIATAKARISSALYRFMVCSIWHNYHAAALELPSSIGTPNGRTMRRLRRIKHVGTGSHPASFRFRLTTRRMLSSCRRTGA